MKKYWQNRNYNRENQEETEDMNNSEHNDYNDQEQQTHLDDGLDDIDQREDELETLRRELEEEKQRHLRTRADFDNYRKRMERELEAQRIYAKKDILRDLLTFLDYFDQAKQQVKDPAAAEGIEIMSRQFNDLLYKHGVRPVECLGRPFDPEEQEGIGYLETGQYDEGCVCEEISPGYKFGDILLKPARVMVARNPDDGKNKQDPGSDQEKDNDNNK